MPLQRVRRRDFIGLEHREPDTQIRRPERMLNSILPPLSPILSISRYKSTFAFTNSLIVFRHRRPSKEQLLVPQGRPTIAHDFNRGFPHSKPSSPDRDGRRGL